MIQHINISLSPKSRGFHIITEEVLSQIGTLPEVGVFQLFIQHTSAGITLNEAADPDVLIDYEEIMNRIVPENLSFLKHTIEGPDDMPAHVKSSLIGHQLTIPIQNGSLVLGTWQGIILGEFRNRGGSRRLIVTIMT